MTYNVFGGTLNLAQLNSTHKYHDYQLANNDAATFASVF